MSAKPMLVAIVACDHDGKTGLKTETWEPPLVPSARQQSRYLVS